MWPRPEKCGLGPNTGPRAKYMARVQEIKRTELLPGPSSPFPRAFFGHHSGQNGGNRRSAPTTAAALRFPPIDRRLERSACCGDKGGCTHCRTLYKACTCRLKRRQRRRRRIRSLGRSLSTRGIRRFLHAARFPLSASEGCSRVAGY